MSDEIVFSLGLELVSRVAPEELPLYKSVADQFERSNRSRRSRSSDDQPLGFGAGEVVVLMAPVILSFSNGFWDALMARAADATFEGIIGRVRRLRSDRRETAEETPPLTAEQVLLVRKLADQEARRLAILSEDQSRLLADALVGALTVSAAS